MYSLPSNQGHPELFDIDYNCDEMDKKTTILLKMVAVKYASDERAIGLREKDGGAGDGFIRFKSFI